MQNEQHLLTKINQNEHWGLLKIFIKECVKKRGGKKGVSIDYSLWLAVLKQNKHHLHRLPLLIP